MSRQPWLVRQRRAPRDELGPSARATGKRAALGRRKQQISEGEEKEDGWSDGQMSGRPLSGDAPHR